MTSQNKKIIILLSFIVILMAWFTPVLENWLGKEIPGEIESLLFCLQTGIGVGIIAYYIGRFVERKKWQNNK